jgi:hypothetical protein
MDLEEFVASTLTQISAGIAKAQEQAAASGAWINPAGKLSSSEERSAIEVDVNAYAYLETVEFDVAVTIGKDESAGAGGGIKVLGLQLGAGADVKYENSSVSRVKFSIPVSWPADRDPDLESRRKAARDDAQKRVLAEASGRGPGFAQRW